MANICDKCRKILQFDVIKCNECKKVFHAECASISRSNCKFINEHRNVKYMCDNCVDNPVPVVNIISEKLESFKQDYDDQFVKQSAAIEELKDSVANLLSNKKSNDEESKKEKFSFADMVKRQSNGPLMIVKPKNATQQSDETKKIIKERIDPVVVPVNTIKSVSNGSVLIQCNDSNKIEECKKSLESHLGEDYEVSVSKQRQPAFKIVGLNEMSSPEILIQRLKSQNAFIPSNAEFTITELKKKESKIFASLRCYASTFKTIMDNGKVLVGWDSCRVFEHFSVLRCFNCCGYHHSAKECTSQTACPKCAGNHKSTECSAETFSCANCIEANAKFKTTMKTDHPCWSRNCPVYKRKVSAETKKIRYEK
jgi:hypothetical protein